MYSTCNYFLYTYIGFGEYILAILISGYEIKDFFFKLKIFRFPKLLYVSEISTVLNL